MWDFGPTSKLVEFCLTLAVVGTCVVLLILFIQIYNYLFLLCVHTLIQNFMKTTDHVYVYTTRN